MVLVLLLLTANAVLLVSVIIIINTIMLLLGCIQKVKVDLRLCFTTDTEREINSPQYKALVFT